MDILKVAKGLRHSSMIPMYDRVELTSRIVKNLAGWKLPTMRQSAFITPYRLRCACWKRQYSIQLHNPPPWRPASVLDEYASLPTFRAYGINTDPSVDGWSVKSGRSVYGN